MAAGQAEKAVGHNFTFPRLTAERFPAARTLRANLAQPHRAAGPSLPGSAGVRPREAPRLDHSRPGTIVQSGLPGALQAGRSMPCWFFLYVQTILIESS